MLSVFVVLLSHFPLLLLGQTLLGKGQLGKGQAGKPDYSGNWKIISPGSGLNDVMKADDKDKKVLSGKAKEDNTVMNFEFKGLKIVLLRPKKMGGVDVHTKGPKALGGITVNLRRPGLKIDWKFIELPSKGLKVPIRINAAAFGNNWSVINEPRKNTAVIIIHGEKEVREDIQT